LDISLLVAVTKMKKSLLLLTALIAAQAYADSNVNITKDVEFERQREEELVARLKRYREEGICHDLMQEYTDYIKPYKDKAELAGTVTDEERKVEGNGWINCRRENSWCDALWINYAADRLHLSGKLGNSLESRAARTQRYEQEFYDKHTSELKRVYRYEKAADAKQVADQEFYKNHIQDETRNKCMPIFMAYFAAKDPSGFRFMEARNDGWQISLLK